jgi:hypothetical protein
VFRRKCDYSLDATFVTRVFRLLDSANFLNVLASTLFVDGLKCFVAARGKVLP